MVNGVGFLKMNALKSDTFVRTVFYRKEDTKERKVF
jgi:hypothetical protein